MQDDDIRHMQLARDEFALARTAATREQREAHRAKANRHIEQIEADALARTAGDGAADDDPGRSASGTTSG